LQEGGAHVKRFLVGRVADPKVSKKRRGAVAAPLPCRVSRPNLGRSHLTAPARQLGLPGGRQVTPDRRTGDVLAPEGSVVSRSPIAG